MKKHTLHVQKRNRKSKKPRSSSLKPRKGTSCSWNQTQQRIYFQFLKDNLQNMKTYENRREFKAFRRMSEKIKSRTSIQVKSHHQKLVQKFGQLQTIVKKLQEYFLLLEKQRMLSSNKANEDFQNEELATKMNDTSKMSHFADQSQYLEGEDFFMKIDERMENVIQGIIEIDINQPLV